MSTTTALVITMTIGKIRTIYHNNGRNNNSSTSTDGETSEPPPSSYRKVPPTGLVPEVDAMLARIFETGLFERKDIDGRALEFLARL